MARLVRVLGRVHCCRLGQTNRNVSFDNYVLRVIPELMVIICIGQCVMQIEVPPELEPFVEQEFATGRYTTREEVVVQALWWLRDERQEALSKNATLLVFPDDIPRVTGQNKANIKRLTKRFNLDTIHVMGDVTVPKNTIRVTQGP